MSFFNQKSSQNSDYKHTLEVFAEMQFQSFDQLSKCQKMELIGAWIDDDNNEDEVINLLIDVKKSRILSESMYESINPKVMGEYIINKMMTGEHISSINIDMGKAYEAYEMSLNNYSSYEQELRESDNHARSIGLDKVKHQRMGL